MSKTTYTAIIIDQQHQLSLDEFSDMLNASPDIVIEMVEQHFIEPIGRVPDEWQFNSVCLKRARTALSFRHDLEINNAGIALALDLLEKVDRMQAELDTLQRFIEED